MYGSRSGFSRASSSGLKALLLCVAFIAGCGGEQDTPEDQVRAVIEGMKTAAEERDLSDFADYIAKDYADRRGNDRAMLLRIVGGYFLRVQDIGLRTGIESIEFPTDRRAAVRMSVAMTGRNPGRSGLLPNADRVAFALEFEDVDEADWRLIRADWNRNPR